MTATPVVVTKPPPERATWTAAKPPPPAPRDPVAESHWNPRAWHGDSEPQW